MGAKTGIAWTDATVNFWWGCTKVGPGCDHCYAEATDKRAGGSHWGLGAPRRKIKSAVQLLHRLDNGYADWAADAIAARENAKVFGFPVPLYGNRRRVFIQSMADLFDLEVPVEWFFEAWFTIIACDRVNVQVCTKRVSVVEKRLAQASENGLGYWPRHAGLLVTTVDGWEADRDIPRLVALKRKFDIPWVGLSIEPMLAGMNLAPFLADLDWVIVGGESGPNRRDFPGLLDAAREIRDQCAAAGVAFFFKQVSAARPTDAMIPADLMIRQFPKALS